MHAVLSIALILGAAFGSEWLVEGWLGEGRRFWVGLVGVGLMVGGGALVQASGVAELTRALRNAVIGAGIGTVLNRAGLRLGWLRRGLRWVGVETEAEAGSQQVPGMSRIGGWLLWLGWAGSLVGLGMVWTGVFGG